ncbi:MAG: CRISPR-associated protein Csm3 [Fusobacteriaceae bacterium]|jgi:CRISPR-associated protein Csm3|nr:csm3 [Fusobacteriales bacterium]MDN5305163.1 CRISPR-associated protein Csm3 [Fusobacteriaceae bacterium]
MDLETKIINKGGEKMQLVEIKEITGIIRLLTGMSIGAGDANIEIGGNDNPIIRNPLTKEVYIPGSSIKGKIRSLSEWYHKKINSEGKVHSCNNANCQICRVFGTGANNKNKEIGMTRLVVRDAYLTKDSKEKLIKLKERTGSDTEWKYENTINRLDSEPMLRNIERIPAGTEFVFNMTYKVLDTNDNAKLDNEYFTEVVLRGLKLLALDGIGGGISRGNGQIEFIELKVNGDDKLKVLSDIKIGG